jgi:hypothetical protein
MQSLKQVGLQQQSCWMRACRRKLIRVRERSECGVQIRRQKNPIFWYGSGVRRPMRFVAPQPQKKRTFAVMAFRFWLRFPGI